MSWGLRDAGSASREAGAGASEAPPSWGRTGGRHERVDEPFLPGKGLAVAPPSVTEPDPLPRPRAIVDPGRRRAQADAFVAEFVGGATWRATLAVLDGAFPGLGLAATLSRRTDELWRMVDAADRRAAVRLGVPLWLDDAGMVFDLSAHLGVRAVRAPLAGRTAPPRASRPYAGAFVIDTLDPLRYHRAVGGPRAPRALAGDHVLPVPDDVEDDDTGVVIVANLRSAGVRVLDSAALWRYASQMITDTLHEAARPETRVRARRALRALRHVVVVDPDLGLGLCLQVDVARVPRCLLAFGVDRTEGLSRFVRP
ncbi:hypothetical protein D0T12_13280 [Actinomadura spongiicola]|uniref:Uncharacterized protein n=1 Tax=Actinomadura spongiicola TaxID=2303421 RepID=A0A372GGN1_9ACTN|nr:hypothetical protein [Actinomadura spongiicola]RFS84535.1 hypothetical protein D0T12_13280 [Actinomadura spongiicola]